jgi:hypothetical protein
MGASGYAYCMAVSHWQPVDEASARRSRGIAVVAVIVLAAVVVVAGIALAMTVLVNPFIG